MRTALYVLAAAGFGALAIVGDPPQADAAVIYPWCAHYNGRGFGGAANCGFVTFSQCLATVSGNGGTCEMNPWYEPQPLQQYAPRARRRAAQF